MSGFFDGAQYFSLIFQNFKFLKYHVHAIRAADKLFGAAAWARNLVAAAFGSGTHFWKEDRGEVKDGGRFHFDYKGDIPRR